MARKPTTKATANSYNWYSRRAGQETGGSGTSWENKLVGSDGLPIVDENGQPIDTRSDIPGALPAYGLNFEQNWPLDGATDGEIAFLEGTTYSGLVWSIGSTPGNMLFYSDVASGLVPSITVPLSGVQNNLTAAPTMHVELVIRHRVNNINLTAAQCPATVGLAHSTLHTGVQHNSIQVDAPEEGGGRVKASWDLGTTSPAIMGTVNSVTFQFGDEPLLIENYLIQIKYLRIYSGY
jgi:hypothetical protein